MPFLAVLFWAACALILYPCALFPLLLALLARRRRAPAPPPYPEDDAWPSVALLVAAHDEAAVLPAKLANTCCLDYPSHRLELLVGSDGSTDATAEFLRRCGDRRLRSFLFPERRGKAAVLNDLAAAARAEILVMSDANSMLAPDAVKRLVRHFGDAGVTCVSGQLLLEQEGGASGEGLYWKYEQWIKRNESRLGFLIGCNGGIYAMRRDCYEPLPPDTIVEDLVITLRAVERGDRVVYEPAARATEPPAPGTRAEMARKARIGAGGFQALRRTAGLLHPRHGVRAFAYWGHKVLRWHVPLFMLVALAASAALAAEPLYAVAFALQLLGAAAAVCACRSGGAPRWLRPLTYFYLMNYALFLGLLRHLAGTQRVTWDRSRPPAPAVAALAAHEDALSA